MNTTLGTWMKLAATASIIVLLIWGLLVSEMSDIATAIANLMGGSESP